MLVGVVAGVAVATAGGVAGYTFLGQPSQVDEQGSAVVMETEETLEQAGGSAEQPMAAPAMQTRAAPAPQPTAAPARAVAQQPAAAPARATAAPAPAPAQQRCWDEEVTVTEAPKDENRVGGTAAGAVVGGVIGKEVGDSDLSTAVGAAAGAFIGRKLQRRVQENRAEQRTTTTIERRCEPV
jgi:uncharacterized protein YcfJ